ncbi:hypothetical protein L7F22_059250 [Adiantum nelumboides]|nr:hypothetical protein [Adiantum nelumboides]
MLLRFIGDGYNGLLGYCMRLHFLFLNEAQKRIALESSFQHVQCNYREDANNLNQKCTEVVKSLHVKNLHQKVADLMKQLEVQRRTSKERFSSFVRVTDNYVHLQNSTSNMRRCIDHLTHLPLEGPKQGNANNNRWSCLPPRAEQERGDFEQPEKVVGAKHQVQHEEVREPVFIELLNEKLADCSPVANAQGWEIDKESEQSQDGDQVLVEQQADEDADMEVKQPSSVHEDMMVCNVNEEQVKPGKEDIKIKVQRPSKKEEATLAMDEQQLDEAVVAELPYDANKVDPFKSAIEMESDEARLNGYVCSYKDGEVFDDMILDEMVWDDFISSLSRDAETWHVQEEQVEEIAAYGVDGEDMVIEDATSVELSKNMIDGPWDPKQVIFEEPKEEQAMDTGGFAKEVCASLLMKMLLDVAMQLAFWRLQECLERISALYGWQEGSNRLDE